MILRSDRLGEVRTMNSGLLAKIVRYKNSKEIDIQFLETGLILTNRFYESFRVGVIKL